MLVCERALRCQHPDNPRNIVCSLGRQTNGKILASTNTHTHTHGLIAMSSLIPTVLVARRSFNIRATNPPKRMLCSTLYTAIYRNTCFAFVESELYPGRFAKMCVRGRTTALQQIALVSEQLKVFVWFTAQKY